MKEITKNEKEFSAIILAAGKSERIGFPKLSLNYNKNRVFCEHIVEEYYDFGCKEIVFVVNEIGFKYLDNNKIIFPENVTIAINKYPDWHRFYSLKVGVKGLMKERTTFVHNVDNPFVNVKVLNKLLVNSTVADYLTPEYKGKGGHPILISETIVKNVKRHREDQLHFKEFLNQYSMARIPVDDEKVLVNINTSEDYKRYFNSIL